VTRSSRARIAVVTQELPRWEHARTARELYDRHIGELVAAGVIGDGAAVPLAGLGLLDRDAMQTPVSRMSQGQQRRLDLAVQLAGRPNLIIFDEPTNHLSAPLVDELTEAIRGSCAAIVLATHDRQLLRDLVDWPRWHLTAPATSREHALQPLRKPGSSERPR
jgi:macrolide transport system ATP-binding/permease protein